ncbi:MAG: ChbG/HpnK family deacetylase [Candidatus Latescibacterota bacterium]
MKKGTEKSLVVLALFCMILLVTPCIATAQAKPGGEIRLVVRGDDMGMTQGSLDAFERAFNRGILTSGAIQVPAPWFEAAAELAKKNPGWCVGVHLCLMGEWIGYRWRPVLPWDKVKSLVDEDGFLYQTVDDVKAANFKPEEMEAELRAQIELALKKGINVQYMDVHYSGVDPKIRDKLAKEYNLPVSMGFGEKRIPGIYMLPEKEKTQALVKQLEALTPGLWIMVNHIVTDTPEGNALIHAAPSDMFPGGGVGKHRAAELDAICSFEVKTAILKKGIKLVSYHQLWLEQQQKQGKK